MMRVLKFLLFAAMSSVIIAVYVVSPIAVTLRPALHGLVPAFAAALAITAAGAGAVTAILWRAAPFVTEPGDLLSMPALPGDDASAARGLTQARG